MNKKEEGIYYVASLLYKCVYVRNKVLYVET